MGISRHLYLGPWVEFRIKSGKEPKRHEFERGKEDILCLADWEYAPRLEDSEWVFRYIPNTPRPGGPKSVAGLDEESGAWPLGCVDNGSNEGEIQDILSMNVYMEEILELEEAYGVKSKCRWGLLKWTS